MVVEPELSFATRLLVFVCAIALVVLGATPESAARSPALQKVIEAADKEGQLLIEWSGARLGGHGGVRAMVNAMNKRYGTNIQISFTPGPSYPVMLNKLTQEWRASQPASSDIQLGAAAHIANGLQSGMLRRLDWAAILERPVPPGADMDRIAPKGAAVAVKSRVVGIPYNTRLVKGDDIPTSMEDVFKPKWKGRIASNVGGSGLYQAAAPDILGYDYMKNYTQRLAKHIGGLMRCGEIERIATGEFAMLVFDCGHADALRMQRRGAPVAHVVVREFSRLSIHYVGIPDHAPHPNAGILFANFLHTEEGQKLVWEYSAADLHIYPGSHVAPMLRELQAARGKVEIETVQRLIEVGVKQIIKAREDFVRILQSGGR